MSLKTIFFDLDATLYPESNGLWPTIRLKIDQYLREVMKIPEAEIPNLRQQYFLQYGTTLRGLQVHFGIKAEDYLNYVHDLPLYKYLQPDPSLRDMLLSLPHPRWIFTNSDRPHAERVMAILGIEDCFEDKIDIYALEPYCKPQKEAYHLAMEWAEVSEPKTCVLLDDSPRNLAPAKEMGFYTILVGQNSTHPAADCTVLDIHDLPYKVPELWK